MSTTRRSFLLSTSAAVAAASLSRGSTAHAAPSETVRVGLIGCGGRGPGVAQNFAKSEGAKVVAVCDPDSNRLGKVAERFSAELAVGDFRRLLDDKSIDAVIVATPDHWHAPAAILACEAGKHVYVEKPCSHNLREGRLLVEAAKRNRSIVQHGTQSRSNPLIIQAIKLLRDGAIGDVLIAKAWNVQRRANIGRMQPSQPPAGVDYDTWVGPAEMVPFQKNRFHYNWHWWHNFGTGDAGNDGAHELDIARWGLGVETHPTRIIGLGGKYFHDDDQEFPDTQTVVFEYPGDGRVGSQRQLVWEMRLWSTNYPFNVDTGVEFYGTKGRLFASKRGKLEVFGERNERIATPKPTEPAQEHAHQQDLIDAVKAGRKPNAEIEIGHLSASLCHLANISTRIARTVQFDPAREQVVGDDQAAALLSRKYRTEGHWAVPRGV
jgi:predicted dehydrogenase